MRSRFAAWCAAAWMMAVSTAFAQDPTGAIEGVVTDPSGAVVANAHVLARHQGTGLTRDTRAGNNGFYRVVGLPVGPYSVIVEAPQLATTVRERGLRSLRAFVSTG